MVVADARLAQRRFARARTQTHGTDAIGDTHQAFQKLRNVALGEPEVAMTSLRFNREELGVEQFRQMGTRSLLGDARSEEHTSELQSLMRNAYAVFCLKKQTDHRRE